MATRRTEYGQAVLNPDQHAKAKRIFLAACAVPPQERDELVGRLCAGDSALRAEVDRLLSHHHTEEGTLGISAFIPRRSPIEGTDAEAPVEINGIRQLSPGVVVSDRYRIIERLGEGGMGVVFRADDLQLGQVVALKFIHPDIASHPTLRSRFESEVKLSREISHPNIARVHDIGEFMGAPFITMEFVDGEDIGSLIRRAGRVSNDRALEIARQLFAGLSAAHINGIIHRDLKPANVMVDSGGEVKIMDFGLAALRGTVSHEEIKAGTPRYMAPEQLEGVAVDELSDIYSAGLVLYELATGQRPNATPTNVTTQRDSHSSQVVSPSRLASDIDPNFEDVIIACLQANPARRPQSALAAAAALPGSNMIAAAISAGRVPSRDLLAASSTQQLTDLRMVRGITALTAFIALVAFGFGLDMHPFSTGGPMRSPDAIKDRAQRILGAANQSVDDTRLHFSFVDGGSLSQSDEVFQNAKNGLDFRISSDSAVVARVSDRVPASQSVHSDLLSIITPSPRPVARELGPTFENKIFFDSAGRLLSMRWQSISSSILDANNEPDVPSLFDTAGLRLQNFVTCEPIGNPLVQFDRQIAFRCAQNEREASTPDRVEIAFNGPRVVSFAAIYQTEVNRPVEAEPSSRAVFLRLARTILLVVLIIVAIPIAWRRTGGQGDVRGALRLATGIFAISMLSELLGMTGGSSPVLFLEELAVRTLVALSSAALLALFYFALEASLRRSQPHTLAGWCRVLNGRINDRVVARDVLVGCLIGVFWAALAFFDRRSITGDFFLGSTLGINWNYLVSIRHGIVGVIEIVRLSFYTSMSFLLIVVISIRIAPSNKRLSTLIAFMIGCIFVAPFTANAYWALTISAIGGVGVALYALLRWGLVTLVVAIAVNKLLVTFPLTLTSNLWYFDFTLLVGLLILGLIAWAHYYATLRLSVDRVN